MPLWDDLSPLVKRYIIVGVVLLGGLLAMRSCVKTEQGTAPPRGLVR